MLEDMEGKILGIVDGGPCTVGVESTIIDLTVEPSRLLRRGIQPVGPKTVHRLGGDAQQAAVRNDFGGFLHVVGRQAVEI